MWIAFFVRLLERRVAAAVAAPSPETPAPLPIRALRVLRLLAQLLWLWCGAVFLARHLGDEKRARFVAGSARGLLRALAVEVVVRGRPPAGRRPVLFVANHVSWLDSYALHTVADGRFVAKSEVRGWPIVGTIAERFGTIFIVRGSPRGAWRAMKAAERLLRAGHSVAVFPEGTTTDGTRMGRFHPALFQAALDAGAAVQPVALRYYGSDGWPTAAAAYVGEMSIADSLGKLTRERRLAVELVFGAPLAPRGDRRELCRAAEDVVRDALALPKHWLIEMGTQRRRPPFTAAGRPAAAPA